MRLLPDIRIWGGIAKRGRGCEWGTLDCKDELRGRLEWGNGSGLTDV